MDDSFIITNDFDLTDPSLSIPQRMGKTLSMAGSSITVTSLTDFAAFIIGSNTSLPALRNFSIYAAIGILFTLAYSVTFFSANLTLDARRQEANRKDCLCCVTSSADPESLGPNVLCRCGTPCGKDPLWMHAVMRKTGEVLASRAGKVASIVVFSAIFIGGVAGIAQIKIQSDNNNFVPPDSYLDTYITDSEALFTSTGENIGVFAGELEYNTPQVQSLMEDLFESVKADPYAATDTLDAWWPAFRDVPTSAACTANASAVTASGRTQGDLCGDVALTSPTDDAFAVKLDRFVNGSEYGFLGGSRFSSDVVFKNDDPAQGIEATRIVRGLMVFLDDSQEQVRVATRYE